MNSLFGCWSMAHSRAVVEKVAVTRLLSSVLAVRRSGYAFGFAEAGRAQAMEFESVTIDAETPRFHRHGHQFVVQGCGEIPHATARPAPDMIVGSGRAVEARFGSGQLQFANLTVLMENFEVAIDRAQGDSR